MLSASSSRGPLHSYQHQHIFTVLPLWRRRYVPSQNVFYYSFSVGSGSAAPRLAYQRPCLARVAASQTIV